MFWPRFQAVSFFCSFCVRSFLVPRAAGKLIPFLFGSLGTPSFSNFPGIDLACTIWEAWFHSSISLLFAVAEACLETESGGWDPQRVCVMLKNPAVPGAFFLPLLWLVSFYCQPWVLKGWQRHSFWLHQGLFLSFTTKIVSQLITIWLFTIICLYTYPHVLLQHTHPKAQHVVKLDATGLSSNVCYKGWV